MNFFHELKKTVVMLFKHPKKLAVVLLWIAIFALVVVLFSWLWDIVMYRLDLFSIDGTDLPKPWGYNLIFR